MNVIIHGDLQPITKTCPRCKCVFEYDPYDIKTELDDVSGHPYKYVECPDCQEPMILRYIR